MKILLSNASPAPIYDQIAGQIKEQIVNGQLTEGFALPSIRRLAKDLQVSVITTKRAYEELEKDGFIHAVRGKGCFVAAQNLELLREMKMRVVEEKLAEAVAEAKSFGIETKLLHEMLTLLTGEDE
ncbi:MAG TPA: GntR family transcriptional regulator [Pirellulaceae bacterium]|jgi:GntR family transcriptional regulator|nr:GntR family transcriptional regulator [Pirellulaceae bacterium]